MAKTLDVYLSKNLVGHLIQDEGGQMVFDYAERWLMDPAAAPLSQSLPLRKDRFTRSECRGFFAGILPEENKRKIVARNLGISAQNDFAMLDRIGGECAGAVTFLPAGDPYPEGDYRYRDLSAVELADILRALPRRPLMAGDDDVRLSLAGAQDKIAAHVSDDKISLPLGGAPSTHILKPAIEHFKGLVFNEAVCMKLAERVGLPTAQVDIGQVDDIDYLLVKRYDRHKDSDDIARRLHQEDFCQALAFVPERKYQSEGGPSLKQCFDLLRDVSSVPAIDLQRLLDSVIYNALIGNHDAHAKNFSLLYDCEPGVSLLGRGAHSVRLAPLYDLVCTIHYPDLTKKMAMKLGGEYASDKLLPKHFEKLAEETGFSRSMLIKRVPELAETVLSALADIEIDHDAAHKVKALIKDRCQFFIRRFKG